MAGTVIGGQKAAKTLKRKYGRNHYKRLGKIGGKLSRGGGFASALRGKDGLTGRERAVIAGAAGGKAERLGSFMVLDESPFDEGFNESTAWDKLRSKLLETLHR